MFITKEILNNIHKIFIENPELCSGLFLLVGLLLGNWIAIGRDRRQEFNEITLSLFIGLNQHIKAERHGQVADTSNWKLIEPYIVFYKRWLFRKAVRCYSEAQKDISTYEPISGVVTFNEKHLLLLMSYARTLLKYLKRR